MSALDKPAAGTLCNVSHPLAPRSANGILLAMLDPAATALVDDFRGATFSNSGAAGAPSWNASPGLTGASSGSSLVLQKSPTVSQFTLAGQNTGASATGYVTVMAICKVASTSIDGPNILGDGINASLILEPCFTTNAKLYALNGGAAHVNTSLDLAVGDWVFAAVCWQNNASYLAAVYKYSTAVWQSFSTSCGSLTNSDGTYTVGSGHPTAPASATDGQLYWGMIDHAQWTYADMQAVALSPFAMFAPLFSPGTLSITGNTSSGIALAVGTTSGGTAPYATRVYRHTSSGFTPPGTGTALGSPLVGASVTYTDSTASPTIPNFYKAICSDAGSSTGVTNQVVAAENQATRVYGFIGDSISVSLQTGQTYTLAQIFQQMARSAFSGERTVTISNQAISGKSTTDWNDTSGGSILVLARAAFVSAGVTDVILMSQTNDSRTDIHNTQATVQSNLSAICTYLLAGSGIVRVWLFDAPYVVPNVHSSGLYTDAATNRIVSYVGTSDALANGTTILSGGRAIFDHFLNVQGELIDGVHPTDLGAHDAAAIMVEKVLLGGTSSSTGHGILGGFSGGFAS